MFGSHFYCYGNASFPLVGISKGSIRTSGFEGCAQYGVPPYLLDVPSVEFRCILHVGLQDFYPCDFFLKFRVY